MRIGVFRWFGAPLGVLISWIGSTGAAHAGGIQLFPVQPHLVPVLVAAIFVLPAGIAGLLSGMRHLWKRPARALAIGLLAGAMVAILSYVEPQLLGLARV